MQTYGGLICALFVMAPNGLSSMLHCADKLELVKQKKKVAVSVPSKF